MGKRARAGKGGRAKMDKGEGRPPDAAERSRIAWARRHPERAAQERALRVARAELVARWKHKNAGTVETHEAHRRRREGALARLHAAGRIDDTELAIGQQIAETAWRIMADAGLRTCSLETRIDASRHGDAFFEALGAVWNEMAYGRWRAALGPDAALVLDIVVHDVGLTRAAAAHGMHARRARRVLAEALAAWARVHAGVRREVSAAELAAAHAGIV